jgi:uncharacterized protein (TIGR02246 family)
MRICAALLLVGGVAAAGLVVRPGSNAPAVAQPAAPLAPAEPAAQPPKGGNPADEAALLKNAEAFVAAFDKGDAKTLAAFWTPDGDYTDQAGRRLAGREAIEKAFTEFFAENKGLKLRIDIDSLRFVGADAAIEDGTTAVIHPDGLPASRARYTIVHARKDGKWYLDSVREAPYTPSSNYENLRGLEWLIGEWADEANQGEAARISFNWTDNQNFVVSNFATTMKGAVIAGGTQWIAWDPANKAVRCWIFESHGGFGEGAWSGGGNAWTVKTTIVLPDGKKATATNTVTRVDADTITWEVKDRAHDGKPLPDIKPTRMKRTPDPARNGR